MIAQLARIPLLAFVSVMHVSAPTAAAQGSLLDSAVFVITRGSTVVGREQFTLRSGRPSGSGGGFTVSVTAHYPPDSPYPTAASVIEFGADSQPISARIDLDRDDRPSVLVAFAPRRITIRTVTPSGESVRQLQGFARTLVLDEFLLSSFAFLPGRADGTVALVNPRAGQRVVVPLTDRGMDRTAVQGADRVLRHLSLGSGRDARHLWYDGEGRLIKLTVPAANVTAVRTPSGRR